jgi:hypothetical protein
MPGSWLIYFSTNPSKVVGMDPETRDRPAGQAVRTMAPWPRKPGYIPRSAAPLFCVLALNLLSSENGVPKLEPLGMGRCFLRRLPRGGSRPEAYRCLHPVLWCLSDRGRVNIEGANSCQQQRLLGSHSRRWRPGTRFWPSHRYQLHAQQWWKQLVSGLLRIPSCQQQEQHIRKSFH